MTYQPISLMAALNNFHPRNPDPYHGAVLAHRPGSATASLVLTQEFDSLKLLAKVVKDLTKLSVTPAEQLTNILTDGRHRLKPEFRRIVVSLFRVDQSELEVIRPGNVFNPYVDLLLRSTRAHPHLGYSAYCFPAPSKLEEEELDADALNFILELKAFCNDPEFQKTLGKFIRRARKNQRRSEAYIDSLFRNKGCRHLVLRLDLSYSSEMTRGGALNTVTEAQARSDFAKWLRWIRLNYPMTGYIWKLEYGTHRGFHFHVIILMNGHLEQSEHLRIMDLGRYWTEEVTEGQGLYFNCNSKTYLRDGTGMIDHSMSEKIAYLKHDVVGYLTKTDYWVSADGGKWFGKGHMPEDLDPLVKRPGRPRTRLGLGSNQVEVDLPTDVPLGLEPLAYRPPQHATAFLQDALPTDLCADLLPDQRGDLKLALTT